METFDIILLVLLGLGAIRGYSNGFVIEVFSIFSFFLGLFLAMRLTAPVATQLFEGHEYFQLWSILVFVGLFILLTFIIKSGAKLIKKALDITLLGVLDNIAGAVVGLLKVALGLSIVVWLCAAAGVDLQTHYAKESVVFPYISVTGTLVFESIAHFFPVIKEWIQSMDGTQDVLALI